MKNNFSIKTIVAIGIGSAVFMILMRFLAIPTPIPNTTINTAYAFLALMAVLFGPIAGISIGFIGHILTDLTAYGSPWFSWIIASAVVGLVMGMLSKRLKVADGEFTKKDSISFNIYQVIANIIAWVIVAPGLDILIYAEPFNKAITQGATAAIFNSITIAVLGTILVYTYANSRVKKGSLELE